ncbi:MAG: insulinase family protein [Rhodospirillales bacterium]|nr:insulinase family protein [Rhodospirillales bacterium]MCB9965043.1 insulinase family protein [Rhodospirillales bacterium]MCB9980371.1 insulinase family protein [Rhodospirillales bacterium]
MSLTFSTLPNGLRIITDHVPEMHSVAFGVWYNVGTRNEQPHQNGIAHLVEHMMFKGTKNRSALQISEEIESVGGQMNAYTSREHTAYFVHLLKDDLPRAIEVLADQLQNTTFPEKELEKERQVILQEIGMTNDTPDDIVFDLYQATAYPDQPFGSPILGTADIVSRIPREDLFSYINTFYTPKTLVISAAGCVKHEEFAAQVARHFTEIPQMSVTPPVASSAMYRGGQEIRQSKNLEQAHIVLGFQGVSRISPDYDAALLLSTILGGGTSSRLFHQIRFERGLVYDIFSHHTAYQDEGQFEIYAGTDPERLGEFMPAVCDELNKIRTESVTPAELSRAKAQIRAGLLMSRESMSSRADRQAKHLLHFKTLPDIEARIARLNAVTSADVHRIAETILKSPPTLAALGPLKKLESLEAIHSRLS